MNLSDLDKMVAESMKDIPSDAELSDEDDDLMVIRSVIYTYMSNITRLPRKVEIRFL